MISHKIKTTLKNNCRRHTKKLYSSSSDQSTVPVLHFGLRNFAVDETWVRPTKNRRFTQRILWHGALKSQITSHHHLGIAVLTADLPRSRNENA